MVRRCPECGEEFQPHVLVCSDCGQALGDPLPEGSSAPAPAGAPPDPSGAGFAGEALPVPLDADADVREAARVLGAAGVRLRLDNGRGGPRMMLPADDYEKARALLEQAGLVAAREPGDPVAVAGGPCPCCGTHVRPGVQDCPECGLTLGGDLRATCPRCQAELEDPLAGCARCRLED